jgi:2-keto-3-deoxy-L-rhamnonate aldolase RhmA
MRPSKILARLRSNQSVQLAQMGYFLPPFIAYAAHEGYDALWLDLEHHTMDSREIQSVLAFAHHYDLDCLIRPPTQEKGQLYRYLEEGAAGLMIPHISSPEQARAVVNKVRFPPLGDRGIEGFGFEADFGLHRADLAEASNRETVLLVQIETPEAVQQVEAIAAVPGIDGLYIGPGDLGLRMAYEAPDTQRSLNDVMRLVSAACVQAGKAWGCYALTESALSEQIALGGRLLVWGADFLSLQQGLQHSKQTLERLLSSPALSNEIKR